MLLKHLNVALWWNITISLLTKFLDRRSSEQNSEFENFKMNNLSWNNSYFSLLWPSIFIHYNLQWNRAGSLWFKRSSSCLLAKIFLIATDWTCRMNLWHVYRATIVCMLPSTHLCCVQSLVSCVPTTPVTDRVNWFLGVCVLRVAVQTSQREKQRRPTTF